CTTMAWIQLQFDYW
nr:immunoglobulin heavy chain junction region [Macaca mulatta]MOY23217.1 immunoglobulin heavy chain junction region [Macaca mulatta]MOY24410.1 immunoglobulin heavy chain junction region [Macaca mulatta]MOY24623.1 immunoglobulin heavy chain junction region [Macaca mulatta]MOY28992.1 immunoglobulin heavy chain junction region [Macaca mulatta]